MSKLQNERRDYPGQKLSRKEIHDDPVKQFEIWMNQVLDAEITDATAMSLATVAKSGQASVRIVLLKDFSDEGFTFYGNYKSRKGRDLEENSRAALLFYWRDFSRQVRIEGIVEKVDRETARRYFQSRPVASQISAAISNQSARIESRSRLEQEVKKYSNEIGEDEVPLPDDWGGWRLKPDYYEFWQGQQDRLHDRIEYVLESGRWQKYRLAP